MIPNAMPWPARTRFALSSTAESTPAPATSTAPPTRDRLKLGTRGVTAPTSLPARRRASGSASRVMKRNSVGSDGRRPISQPEGWTYPMA